MSEPFVWGSAGARMTPDDVERKRKIAQVLMKEGSNYSPVQHWTQGLARVAQALVGGYQERQANDAEKANAAESASLLTGLLGGAGGAPAAMTAAAASAPSESTADPAAAVAKAPADLLPRFAQAEAQYGLPKNFLAQTARIESNFNPAAANPNSSARGLFQFVKGTAKDYGLTNPLDPIASTDAAARLAADNKATLTRALGREPTAGELYLAHQQGGGGASKLLANPNARAVDIVGLDAVRLNGGNPNMTAAEFARRWTSKLAANEADMPAPGAMPAEAPAGQGGFVVPPGEQPAPAMTGATFDAITSGLPPAAPPAPAMTGQTFDAITSGEPPLDPVFRAEGVAQPWMGTTMQPQAPMVAQAPPPMPPPRPADLPAPGAVEAIGQMPPQAAPQPQMMPDLSNSPDGGARQLQVMAEQARQIQPAAPQAPANPQERVTAAFAGGGAPAAPQAAQSPAVAAVAQAVAQNPSDPLARALTSPYVNDATKKVAMALLVKRIEGDTQGKWAEQRLEDGSIAQRNSRTGELKIVRPGVDPLDREGKQLEIDAKRKALGETKPPPTLKVKQADGSEVTLEWDAKAGTYVPLRAPLGGAAVGPAPANPFALPGKPTEAQSKDAGFAGRMVESHNLINQLEGVGVDKVQATLGALPLVGNALSSANKQKFEQAKRNFITSILRKESGAVIADSEFATEEKKYFPQVGDSPQVIEQKRAARELAIEGVLAGAGSGYKVPENYKPTRGQKPAEKPKGDAPAPPAGVDAKVWQFMTPEERALWK
jgi:hypothetical protein